jgi:hypothetical protein
MSTASSSSGANPRKAMRLQMPLQDNPASISKCVPDEDTTEQFPLLPLARTVMETATPAA